MEAAATRAQQTIEWLESHSFMPEEQLGNWAHVVGARARRIGPAVCNHLTLSVDKECSMVCAYRDGVRSSET